MSTQTLLGHSFPTPCKRCGGALYRQVDYCPYCGAVHPLDAGPHKRTVIPGSRASATNKATQKNSLDAATADETDPTTRATFADEPARGESAMPVSALVSPDTQIPHLPVLANTASRGAIPLRKVLYGIGAVGVIGLAYGGYALFSDHDSSNGMVGQSSETETTQDARTTTGTIALFTPSANQAATAGKSAMPANPAKAAQAMPATPVAPPVAVAPAKPAPQFRDAAQALQAARLAFRANDLSAAQAALGAAQTMQPDSSDAQDLAAELKPLTARRDAALQAAQTCAAQQSWPCARQHANEALAIDTGNDTAKSILARVIRETGWAPLNPHAAAGAAQAKPSAQQVVQLQTPLPKGMPSNSEVVVAAPRSAAATPDGNSVEARERAIKDSGWKRPATNAAKPAAGGSPSQ